MKKNYKENNYNKIQRFSIRKYSFGAASVAIATYLMFMGNGAVYAAQEGGATESTEPKVGKVVTPEKDLKNKTPKPESLDKSKLIGLIAEIETKLSDGKYDNKTAESLSSLKSAVDSAKSTVVNATSQDELNKAYSNLANTVSSTTQTEKNEAPKEDTTDRAATAAKHEPTTVNVGNLSYTLEFSDDTKKEIYAYNEEDADISIAVNSTAGKITSASVKSASGQYMNKKRNNLIHLKLKKSTDLVGCILRL